MNTPCLRTHNPPIFFFLIFIFLCGILALPFCLWCCLDGVSDFGTQLFLAAVVLSPITVLISLLASWRLRVLSKRIACLIFGIGLPFSLAFAFIFSGCCEGYFPLYPHVDTVFAAGFSHQRWRAVQLGMTKEQVVELLGCPLTNTNRSPNIWWYTADGKCKWNDFAWHSKELQFSPQGVVTSKIDRWYTD